MAISSAISSTSSNDQLAQDHKLTLKEIITKIVIPILIALALLITTICLLQVFPLFVSVIFIAGVLVGTCVAIRNYFNLEKIQELTKKVETVYQEHLSIDSAKGKVAAAQQALLIQPSIQAFLDRTQRSLEGLPPSGPSFLDQWLANNS